MSEVGYQMILDEINKVFFLKQVKGRGYIDTGTSVISEFCTPLVPKGHELFQVIWSIVEEHPLNVQDENGGLEV